MTGSTPTGSGVAPDPGATQGPAAAPARHDGSANARGRRLLSRLPPHAWFAVVGLASFVLAALLGPLVRPYDPYATNLSDRLLAPGSTRTDGSIAWLGTDQLGRDLLANVFSGSRISLLVGVSTVLIGGAVGLLIGLLSGYFGGRVDSVLSRIGDVQLAFPSLLLAILIAGVLGPSVTNIVITLAVTRWVIFARVVRASAASARTLEYVDSARVLGAGHARILRRAILPAVWQPLLVAATVQLGLVMVAEASLSFLGLGVPPDQASWGATVSAGRDYLGSAWWISTMPAVALALVVACVGIIGDRFRTLTDPNARI